jgi:hypothetical protein
LIVGIRGEERHHTGLGYSGREEHATSFNDDIETWLSFACTRAQYSHIGEEMSNIFSNSFYVLLRIVQFCAVQKPARNRMGYIMRTVGSHSDQGYQKWDGSSSDSFILKIVFCQKTDYRQYFHRPREHLQLSLSHTASTQVDRTHLRIDWWLIDGHQNCGYIMDEFFDEISVLDTSTESLSSNFSELSDFSLKR